MKTIILSRSDTVFLLSAKKPQIIITSTETALKFGVKNTSKVQDPDKALAILDADPESVKLVFKDSVTLKCVINALIGGDSIWPFPSTEDEKSLTE